MVPAGGAFVNFHLKSVLASVHALVPLAGPG